MIAPPRDWEFLTTGDMAGSIILSPDAANTVFGARNAKSQSMLFLRSARRPFRSSLEEETSVEQRDSGMLNRRTLVDAKASAASSHWNVPITSAPASSNLDLDSSNIAVVNAEAGVNAALQNLESAKAALLQAEANAAKSDADLIRYDQLVAKEDISHQCS